MTRRTSNFTLVEIIAVLLVIAIMAAVAAPKFVSIADEARIGVAQAGINEAKASLSVAFHKAYLQQFQADGTTAVGAADVIAATGLTSPVAFGDVTVTMAANAGDTAVDLVATKVGSHTFAVADPDVRPKGVWAVPTP